MIMWKFFVICGDQRVYATDRARDAHYNARRIAREKQLPAIVVRTVCRWTMEPVRTNA